MKILSNRVDRNRLSVGNGSKEASVTKKSRKSEGVWNGFALESGTYYDGEGELLVLVVCHSLYDIFIFGSSF